MRKDSRPLFTTQLPGTRCRTRDFGKEKVGGRLNASFVQVARRLLIGITGSGLLLSGSVPAFLLSWAIVVQGQPVSMRFALLGYSMSLLGIVLGLILLFRFPYATSHRPDGLLIKFVLYEQSVSWEQVSWYRYIARRWKQNKKVALLTLMKLVEKDGRCWFVLLEIESLEFKRGWRTRDYTSELNTIIPERDITRR